jgi:biotin transport system substrate-specific component
MPQVLVQLRRAAALDVMTTVPARRALALLTCVLLTALSAHIAVPVPGTAVPVTMQTLVVMLSGLLLGPALGASAMTLYLLAGAAGLPVFAAGAGVAYLFGPTGGYLLAFPAAAAIGGTVARALTGGVSGAGQGVGGGGVRLLALGAAATLTAATVFAGGWAQLSVMTGDPATALRLGVLPFLLGDALKVVLAVLLATRLRRRTLSLL